MRMRTNEFLDAICHGLNRELGSLTLDATDETVEEWDSMGHLTIISIVESKLNVSLEAEGRQVFTSLRELADFLKAKGALEDDS